MWGWLLRRNNPDLKEIKRERMTKRESQLAEGYETLVRVKDKQIKALERVLESYELLEERGIMHSPDLDVPEGANLIDGVIEWIKSADDIPRMAKGPIVAYLKKRQPELDALATRFLDTQMSRLMERKTEKPETGN